MKNPPLSVRQILHLKARYRVLSLKLGSFELLSQGSVMPQLPKAWRWTRKVSGKTVTRGLTSVQAGRMKQAIANQRTMDKIIDEMREITQKLIFGEPKTIPPSKPEKHPKSALT